MKKCTKENGYQVQEKLAEKKISQTLQQSVMRIICKKWQYLCMTVLACYPSAQAAKVYC